MLEIVQMVGFSIEGILYESIGILKYYQRDGYSIFLTTDL